MYRDPTNLSAYLRDCDTFDRAYAARLDMKRDEASQLSISDIRKRFSDPDLTALLEIVIQRYGSNLRGRELRLMDGNEAFIVQSAANIINQARKNVEDMNEYYGIDLRDAAQKSPEYWRDLIYDKARGGMPEDVLGNLVKLGEKAIDSFYGTLPVNQLCKPAMVRKIQKYKSALQTAAETGKRDKTKYAKQLRREQIESQQGELF